MECRLRFLFVPRSFVCLSARIAFATLRERGPDRERSGTQMKLLNKVRETGTPPSAPLHLALYQSDKKVMEK